MSSLTSEFEGPTESSPVAQNIKKRKASQEELSIIELKSRIPPEKFSNLIQLIFSLSNNIPESTSELELRLQIIKLAQERHQIIISDNDIKIIITAAKFCATKVEFKTKRFEIAQKNFEAAKIDYEKKMKQFNNEYHIWERGKRVKNVNGKRKEAGKITREPERPNPPTEPIFPKLSEFISEFHELGAKLKENKEIRLNSFVRKKADEDDHHGLNNEGNEAPIKDSSELKESLSERKGNEANEEEKIETKIKLSNKERINDQKKKKKEIKRQVRQNVDEQRSEIKEREKKKQKLTDLAIELAEQQIEQGKQQSELMELEKIYLKQHIIPLIHDENDSNTEQKNEE